MIGQPFVRLIGVALFTGASLLALAPAAFAASASTADTPVATAQTDINAASQGAPEPHALEEVVVTAQRRAENLQVVPISVTVITGKTLEESNFQSVTDLQYLVPGVTYDPTQGSAFQIRGVGSESFDFSNEKSVSLVVDDVVMDGQRDNGLTGLQDIKSVDVLMGPQGTLFGKNATSGVISITTNDPVLDTWSAKGGVSYGERNDTNDNFTINAPLGSMMALRVSGFYQGQDGVGDYTTLDRKLDSFDEYGYRAKLLFQPTNALQVLFTNDYERHWDNSIRTAVSGASPTVTSEEIALGVTPGPQNASDADGQEGEIKTASWGDALTVRYKMFGGTLTSVTAYRHTIYDNVTPADLLPGNEYAYIPYNDGGLTTSKVSEELRYASPTGQFIEYVGGLFYDRLLADQTQLQWATLGAPLVSATGVPDTTLYALTGAIGKSGDESLFEARNTSTAGFGQIKFNFTKAFDVAFGGRFTYDDNSQSLTFPYVNPIPITGYAETFIATSAPPIYPQGGVTAHNFSYRIAPEYRLTPDIMVYASYSTGYKPPGVAFVGNKYDPYKAETVEAYEIGEKSEFFSHRLRLNFDLFDEQFTDFQATILTAIPGSVTLQSVIGNAGGLKSEGAESSFALRATDNLSFSGSVSCTDAYFTNYVYNTTTNYTGTNLTNAPRWSTFISANYNHNVGPLLMAANLDYSYRSRVWTVTGQPAYSEVNGYGLVNGRISFSPPQSKLQFGVYARNLLNTYFSTGWQEYGSLGLVHYISLDAYRTVGVFARYAY
jgi:iron complex outermembrane receptor protein